MNAIGKEIFDDLQEVIKDTNAENEAFRTEYVIADWLSLPKEGRRQYAKDRGLADKTSDQVAKAYVIEAAETIMAIYRIPRNSALKRALVKYGVAKGYGRTLNDIYRKLNIKMIHGEGYFDTGYGNDMIDHDLLGGTGDGAATHEFLEIINQQKEIDYDINTSSI